MEIETPFGTLHARLRTEVEGIKRKARGWLHAGDLAVLAAEAVFPSTTFSVGFSVEADGEDTVTLRLCAPPVGLYLGLDCHKLGGAIAEWVQRRCSRCGEQSCTPVPEDERRVTCDACGFVRYRYSTTWERTLDLRVFNWAVWWNLWTNSNSWDAETPRWRSGSWQPFGDPGKCLEREELEVRDVDVPFPGHTFRARAKRERIVVNHPWMPLLRKTMQVVDLDFRPFKATHGMPEGRRGRIWQSSREAASIDERIGQFVGEELHRNPRPPLTPVRARDKLAEAFISWLGMSGAPDAVERALLYVTSFEGTRMQVTLGWKPVLERGGKAIIADTRERAAAQAADYVPPSLEPLEGDPRGEG